MMKSTPVWLVAILVLAGCQGGKSGETVKKDTSAPAQSQGKEEGPTITEEDIVRLSQEAAEKQKGSFDVKPSEELGYKATDKKTEQSLGEKVDQALASMEPFFVKTQFSMNDGGDRTIASPTIKMQDADNYTIEYVVPEYPSTISRLIANDGKRAMFQDREFRDYDMKPLPEKLGKAELKEWMSEFPERMFAGIGEGEKHWSKVISALQDPKNGFDTEITEKVTDVSYINDKGKIVDQGITRAFYRVVAKSEKDQAEVEIVIDSLRFVPVTVRTNQVREDGKERQIWWAGNWLFGGKFTDKDFQIPNA